MTSVRSSIPALIKADLLKQDDRLYGYKGGNQLGGTVMKGSHYKFGQYLPESILKSGYKLGPRVKRAGAVIGGRYDGGSVVGGRSKGLRPPTSWNLEVKAVRLANPRLTFGQASRLASKMRKGM